MAYNVNVNDNEYPPVRAARPVPDAHGQAAMLLVESLLHGLVARSALTVADAVEIVEVAIDVQAEAGTDMEDTPANVARSLTMLHAISGSLSRDA